MYETKENRKPKAEFYVSLTNGGVYPALRNVPGYEDDNPAEWRVATADEVEAHKAGKKPVTRVPSDEVLLTAPAPAASPQSIQLADDEAPEPQAVLQQAAAALPPAPPAAPAPLDPPPLPPQFGNGPAPAPFAGFGQNG